MVGFKKSAGGVFVSNHEWRRFAHTPRAFPARRLIIWGPTARSLQSGQFHSGNSGCLSKSCCTLFSEWFHIRVSQHLTTSSCRRLPIRVALNRCRFPIPMLSAGYERCCNEQKLFCHYSALRSRHHCKSDGHRGKGDVWLQKALRVVQ